MTFDIGLHEVCVLVPCRRDEDGLLATSVPFIYRNVFVTKHPPAQQLFFQISPVEARTCRVIEHNAPFGQTCRWPFQIVGMESAVER